MKVTLFQTLLLEWFALYGRKQLPWQQNSPPYFVWLSEIMLQQTQVATVIPYFTRFTQTFPTIQSLASASEDQVLHLWAGLGYYSRARCLKQAAQIIVEKHNGLLPHTLSELMALPGVGRSTAGAILSLAFNQATPILDGNVKRLLTRLHGLCTPINEKETEETLWKLATRYLSRQKAAHYTQAMMDFGALICTRHKPQCTVCPFQSTCIAYKKNLVAQLPYKRKTAPLPTRQATFFICQRNQHILLQKRAPIGIWGGLWCLPSLPGKPMLEMMLTFCESHFYHAIEDYKYLPSFKHTFTHYHLEIFPVMIKLPNKLSMSMMENHQILWYDLHHPPAIGLPKPIQLLLANLLANLNTEKQYL